MRRNEKAAATHKRMCDDPRFGYSWEERWGHSPETWTIGGEKLTINVGDYDCSSSTITAWKLALVGTKYEGKLDAATYTGNMREVFTRSGLFEWKPMSFLAQPGDLYLNEENHVAMCQTQEPDVLSEFSWGDNGAYGNKRGDQSGGESSVHGFYDYPWDGILHYNGKADSGDVKTTLPAQPRYRAKGKSKWGSWKSSRQSAKVTGGIYDIEFSGLPSGSWFRLTLEDGRVLKKNAHNTTGKRLSGIEVCYKTANPSKTGTWDAYYRIRSIENGWGKWERNVADGGAGGLGPIDVLQFIIKRR